MTAPSHRSWRAQRRVVVMLTLGPGSPTSTSDLLPSMARGPSRGGAQAAHIDTGLRCSGRITPLSRPGATPGNASRLSPALRPGRSGPPENGDTGSLARPAGAWRRLPS